MADGSTRAVLRAALRDVWQTVRRADFAIAYCVAVTVVTVWSCVQSPARHEEILDYVSTNLDNLQSHPVTSMIGSAFVVSNLAGLYLLVPLLVVLAYLQRFVGRVAALVVGLAGHVGGTLVVATALTTGIFRGFVESSVADDTDVGVSYVMASATGFLVLAVPWRWRPWYLAALAVYWLAPSLVTRSFTDLGHASALSIGLLMGLVASRVVSFDRRARRNGERGVEPAGRV